MLARMKHSEQSVTLNQPACAISVAVVKQGASLSSCPVFGALGAQGLGCQL